MDLWSRCRCLKAFVNEGNIIWIEFYSNKGEAQMFCRKAFAARTREGDEDVSFGWGLFAGLE